MEQDVIKRDIYPVLPEKIVSNLNKAQYRQRERIEEIRIRANRPLMIGIDGKDINPDDKEKIIVSKQDIDKTIQYMAEYSIYALEDELRQGFLTLRGGHRVGVVGRIVADRGEIRTIKNISGMNIRIAREIKGCSEKLIQRIYCNRMKHTLIVSPPGCGKTTLMRDMIRVLSDGIGKSPILGCKVGLVDERSEISGCYMGVPQMDLGIRTDVLDACPKVQGINMLLRSMAPDVIAVDEIGSIKDSEAIEDAIYAGVKVLATAHGKDMDEINKRPGIKRLMDMHAFECIVILSRRNGPGTIENVINV